ncbi:hypothetical protein P3L10_015857 [Capsicum annuum]
MGTSFVVMIAYIDAIWFRGLFCYSCATLGGLVRLLIYCEVMPSQYCQIFGPQPNQREDIQLQQVEEMGKICLKMTFNKVLVPVSAT